MTCTIRRFAYTHRSIAGLSLLLPLLAALLFTASAKAHESRPAYLEIKETAPNQFSLLWRTPVLAGNRLLIKLELPEGVKELQPVVVQELSDSRVERHLIDAGADGLSGQRIDFVGLQFTITDVLARVELLDGRNWTVIARPSKPYIEIAESQNRWQVAGTYLLQGIRHITMGADHLLFVLALLLIVKSRWMLLKTITGFTVAHSITLALATLGVAQPAVAPLNVAIALSILFIAPEVVRSLHGKTSFTIRHPWVVAFAFGLLHGFGFASALSEAGLPRSELPLALVSFNVGVEIGQLTFVALVLGLMVSFRILRMNWPRWSQAFPAYVVGTLGAFWTVQRFLMMMGNIR